MFILVATPWSGYPFCSSLWFKCLFRSLCSHSSELSLCSSDVKTKSFGCCNCLLDATGKFPKLGLVWVSLCKFNLCIETKVPMLCGSSLLLIGFSSSWSSSGQCVSELLALLLGEPTCSLLQVLD